MGLASEAKLRALLEKISGHLPRRRLQGRGYRTRRGRAGFWKRNCLGETSRAVKIDLVKADWFAPTGRTKSGLLEQNVRAGLQTGSAD